MYQIVSVRQFADAYARSDAGVAQTEALLKPFKCTKESDKALAWTKFALSGMSASWVDSFARIAHLLFLHGPWGLYAWCLDGFSSTFSAPEGHPSTQLIYSG